ncbi:MAG: glycosyltransferase family 2 protein [Lachnospiraceae bacterium]|nr:glycosyltransferase family 2 protein [Lachnospiraceae bacterium]
MSDSLITIIMTAYNSEQTIEKSIKSVLKQLYPIYELIIVDDGSTDRTKEICCKYVGEKVKLLEKENGGPSSARNMALKFAKGKYICFLDSDDTYESCFLETMVENIKQDYDMCICPYYICKNKIKKEPQILFAKLTSNQAMLEVLRNESLGGFLWNKIFIREIIVLNKIIFNENVYVCEDLLFVEEYLHYCKNIKVLDIPMYNYFMTENSISRTLSPKKISMLNSFLDMWNFSVDREYKEIVAKRFIEQFLSFYGRLDYDRKYILELYSKIRSLVKEENISIYRCLNLRTRLKYFIFIISPQFFLKIYRLLG